MTTLTIDLPDKLAQDAQEAGLLEQEAIEIMLRENLRRRGVDELFQAMDRMAAVDTPPVMSPEEVAEEIRKIRAERRSQNAR
jgi:Arc/MetJ family transcription regulator